MLELIVCATVPVILVEGTGNGYLLRKRWLMMNQKEKDELSVQRHNEYVKNSLARLKALSKSGYKQYRWIHQGKDSHNCPVCLENNGKTFDFDAPNPKSGHPGEGLCCTDGICQCIWRIVLEKRYI